MRKTVALTLAIVMLAVALLPVPVAAQAPGGGVAVPISTPGFIGTLTLRSFGLVDGALTAFGTLAGTATDAVGNTTVFIRQVALPVLDITQGASCEILNLVLGPLDLNVLGLVIHLDQVVLDITAVPGPGNLLGNLLCAIAGLLDPGPGLATNLQQLITLLNRLLSLL